MGLDAVELILAVEGNFGVTISDDEVSKVVTVGALVDLVHLKTKMGQTLSRDVVRERVHQDVCHFLGVKSCCDGDRFVEDLGME